jgi:hypothetical protein
MEENFGFYDLPGHDGWSETEIPICRETEQKINTLIER